MARIAAPGMERMTLVARLVNLERVEHEQLSRFLVGLIIGLSPSCRVDDCSHWARLPEVVSRLDAHLLHNNMPIDFITSDDQVVMHNQYCEGIDYRGVLGWNRVGIQLFFPLSPRVALMLFDPAVYKVEGTRHGKRAMAITAPGDVHCLNSLQALNALENVFSLQAGDGFEAFCLEMAARRHESRQRFVESTPTEEPDGRMSMLLHSFESLLPTALSLEGVVLRKRARKVPLHARAGRARDGVPPRRAGASFVRYPISATFDR